MPERSLTQPWEDFAFSRLASGPLFFYVGAGLSIAAGLVRWNEMPSMIWWYRRHYEGRTRQRACPPDDESDETAKKNAAFLQSFVAQPERKNRLIRSLSRQSRDPRGLGRTALLNMMLRYRAPRLQFTEDNCKAAPVPRDPKKPHARPGKEPSAEDLVLHSLIWRSACNGVLTTNYDMLLEHAYSLFHHGAALRSYRYNADFLRYLLSNPRFVLKLHGDINDFGSMELDPDGAWEKKRKKKGRFVDQENRGDDLKRVYRAILAQGHMVYVGCGFRDRTIEELHRFWVNNPYPGEQRNFRIALIPGPPLIPESELPKGLDRFQDIEFLTFNSGWHEVREFLERVEGARSGARVDWTPSLESRDIHRQIFLAWDATPPAQHLETEPWTCRGVRPRAERPPGDSKQA